MPFITKYIPENNGTRFAFKIGDTEFFGASHNLGIVATRLTQPGEVPFHIGHENRHTTGAKILGQSLQRHRLTGAGGARDQTVPVSQFRQQIDRVLGLGDEDGIAHDMFGSIFTGSRRSVTPQCCGCLLPSTPRAED